MSVRSTLVQADAMPEWLILGGNAFLAMWILLAAGGSWWLRSRGGAPGGVGAATAAIVAGLMLAASLAAIVIARVRSSVLMIQAVVTSCVFAVGLLWSAGVAIRGIPEGNFRWSFGLLTGCVVFTTYSLSRFVLRRVWRGATVFLYAPLATGCIALLVEVAVFLRFIGRHHL